MYKIKDKDGVSWKCNKIGISYYCNDEELKLLDLNKTLDILYKEDYTREVLCISKIKESCNE